MAEEHWSESAKADADAQSGGSQAGSAVQDCPQEADGIIPIYDTPPEQDVAPGFQFEDPPAVIPRFSTPPSPQALPSYETPPSPHATPAHEAPPPLALTTSAQIVAPPTAVPGSETIKATVWIEILVVDDQDQPIANEPCKITLADGTVRDETLDANGVLRLENIPPGECKFSLTNRDDWEPAETATETAWIEVGVLDNEGLPIADENYKIVLPDGSEQEGKTDAKGRFKMSDITPGSCKITFPDRDGNSVELDNS